MQSWELKVSYTVVHWSTVTETRSEKNISSFGFLYATTLLQQLLFSQLTSNWMLRISIGKWHAFCPTCIYFPYISSVIVAVNPTSLRISCTKEKGWNFCIYTLLGVLKISWRRRLSSRADLPTLPSRLQDDDVSFRFFTLLIRSPDFR